MRAQNVLHAVAGIDQDEPGICLDQEAMRGNIAKETPAGAIEESAAEGTVRAAVEMMDTHCLVTVWRQAAEAMAALPWMKASTSSLNASWCVAE